MLWLPLLSKKHRIKLFRKCQEKSLGRTFGFEPKTPGWKPGTLPLRHIRFFGTPGGNRTLFFRLKVGDPNSNVDDRGIIYNTYVYISSLT